MDNPKRKQDLEAIRVERKRDLQLEIYHREKKLWFCDEATEKQILDELAQENVRGTSRSLNSFWKACFWASTAITVWAVLLR